MSNTNSENWAKPESVNLPSELRISKFAEARVKEIITLTDFIGKIFLEWILTCSNFAIQRFISELYLTKHQLLSKTQIVFLRSQPILIVKGFSYRLAYQNGIWFDQELPG